MRRAVDGGHLCVCAVRFFEISDGFCKQEVSQDAIPTQLRSITVWAIEYRKIVFVLMLNLAKRQLL